jgi:uncharacterized protein
VNVARIGLDRATNTPVLLLREAVGDRAVPIWIGVPEASAIAIALQKVDVPRPMTHDLLLHVLRGLGGEVVRVAVTEARDNTYFAELLIRRGSQELAAVDARPSDAIALALRAGAPILVAESLLHAVGTDEGEAPWPLKSDALRAYLEGLDPQDFGRFQP